MVDGIYRPVMSEGIMTRCVLIIFSFGIIF